MRIFHVKPWSKTVLLSLFLFCVSFHAQSQVVTTVAGGAGGYLDTTISKVKFNGPWGIVVDAFGNIYVADRGNNRIRKISTDGTVSTFAGNGTAGYLDGQGTNAEFYAPNLLAIDADNNIYVADQGNHRIRKITPSGLVTNFAGNGILGNVNGQAANAEFNRPSGVAVDAAKNVYVADQWNNVIRKISSSGVVTTLAGGSQGYQNGTGANARFNGPNGITVDNQGNVFVAEIGNNVIRKITPSGVVTTFAGSGFAGYQDGVGTNTSFYGPLGLTIDAQNNLYLADLINNRIRKITPTQVVTTVAGTDTIGFVDGAGANAKFYGPFGISIDAQGNLYAADAGNNSIRKITPAGQVTTVAGNGLAGYVDGVTINAELYGPNGVVGDNAGNLYVADLRNHRIRKITLSGVLSTVAGNGLAGFADGPGATAEFNSPSGLAIDPQNNLYVTEAQGHRIRKITPDGVVSTFAGNGTAGFADGVAANAQFNHPNRIALDATGNVYVVDVYNQRIRKITTTGIVSTLAGNGTAGYADGPGATAEFNYPEGIVIDPQGNAYVADHDNNRIRKITPAGVVSTIAGNGAAGYANGTGLNAIFNQPGGITITKEGDFYISDETGNRIRKMTAAGEVSLWAGNGVAGLVDGAAATAEFNDVRALCVDAAGNVFVPDYNNNKIRKITPGSNSTLPLSFLNFSVALKNNDVLLNWQTASEENTGYFIILRSMDGQNFNEIGKIAAAGNSSSKNYTYTDANAAALKAGTLFYRVKEMDKDGANNYSPVQKISLAKDKPLFSVSPNPANGFVLIHSSQNVAGAQIKITDMNGKTVYSRKKSFAAGEQLKIPLPPLAGQVLVVTIESGNKQEQFKVVSLSQ